MYLQSASLIDAFEIVTVLLHTVDSSMATVVLHLIQLINSLPLVPFWSFIGNIVKQFLYF